MGQRLLVFQDCVLVQKLLITYDKAESNSDPAKVQGVPSVQDEYFNVHFLTYGYH